MKFIIFILYSISIYANNIVQKEIDLNLEKFLNKKDILIREKKEFLSIINEDIKCIENAKNNRELGACKQILDRKIKHSNEELQIYLKKLKNK